MKINHKISLSVDSDIRKALAEIGIDTKLGFWSFEIDEDHPAWPKIEPLIQGWQSVDIITTKFTKSELNKASYLRLSADWHWGYPQPEDDFGYLKESYDLSNYSPNSGIGKVQKSPIRIKGEPKWGDKGILQLNWLFDVFFVRPEVWESVFKPFGIGCMPVIDHMKDAPCKTIVQLIPQELVHLKMTGYPNEICPDTGRGKYMLVARGFFPSIQDGCDSDFVQSEEFFGSGHSAFRASIISASLYKKLSEHNIRGVDFTPLETKCFNI